MNYFKFVKAESRIVFALIQLIEKKKILIDEQALNDLFKKNYDLVSSRDILFDFFKISIFNRKDNLVFLDDVSLKTTGFMFLVNETEESIANKLEIFIKKRMTV